MMKKIFMIMVLVMFFDVVVCLAQETGSQPQGECTGDSVPLETDPDDSGLVEGAILNLEELEASIQQGPVFESKYGCEKATSTPTCTITLDGEEHTGSKKCMFAFDFSNMEWGDDPPPCHVIEQRRAGESCNKGGKSGEIRFTMKNAPVPGSTSPGFVMHKYNYCDTESPTVQPCDVGERVTGKCKCPSEPTPLEPAAGEEMWCCSDGGSGTKCEDCKITGLNDARKECSCTDCDKIGCFTICNKNYPNMIKSLDQCEADKCVGEKEGETPQLCELTVNLPTPFPFGIVYKVEVVRGDYRASGTKTRFIVPESGQYNVELTLRKEGVEEKLPPKTVHVQC